MEEVISDLQTRHPEAKVEVEGGMIWPPDGAHGEDRGALRPCPPARSRHRLRAAGGARRWRQRRLPLR